MSRLTRRDFLQGSLATAAAVTLTSGRVLGANDTLRIAVAGLNGRGSAHVDAFSKIPGVEIVYLVDPDTGAIAVRADQGYAVSTATLLDCYDRAEGVFKFDLSTCAAGKKKR